MNIRNARDSDITDLLPLLTELGYSTSIEEFILRFKKFLQEAGYGVAVYELDGQIAGCIAWSRSMLFVSNSTRFHIEALIVAASCRGIGVGKKLMRFVENIAGKSSPAIIDLTSGLRREKDGTHEFYKQLGYKNEGDRAKLYLRKEIS